MIGEDISADWEDEHRLAELVARAPVMMTIVDADGSVRWSSPGTRQVLGREPEELLGPPQLDKMHPDDAPMLLAGVASMRGSRRHGETSASTMEYRIRHADGRWRWINFTIEDFTGVEPINGVVCYGQDVTEQRMAAEYAALDGEIHGAIVAGTPFDLVLQSLCDRLIEILDATVVWVGLAEEDGTVSMRGSAGPIREVFRGTSPRWDDTPVGRGPVGECIRQRSTIVTDVESARRGRDDLLLEIPFPVNREQPVGLLDLVRKTGIWMRAPVPGLGGPLEPLGQCMASALPEQLCGLASVLTTRNVGGLLHHGFDDGGVGACRLFAVVAPGHPYTL
jgi:PAS domain S-box-containing protein